MNMIKFKPNFVEMENDLKECIPQAYLSISPNNLTYYEVEYLPDSNSYWNGGKFIFSFELPNDYPYNPPKIKCKTKIFHPNIDYDGNVCVELSNGWKCCFSLSSVPAMVYLLFLEPNSLNCLNQEAGKLLNDDIEKFKQTVKLTLQGGSHFGQDFPVFNKN